MSKNNQNQFANNLRKMNFGQSISSSRNDRNYVAAEIRRLNSERNPYQFKQANDKSGGITVSRIVPTNLYDRSLYIESIGKKQLENSLRSNNWSKEAAAREFGISARSIGRMIAKHSIAAKRYTPTTSSKTSTSSKASTSSKSSTSSKTSSSKSKSNSKNKTR